MVSKTGFRILAGLLVLSIAFLPAGGRAAGAFQVHVDYLDNSQFPQVDVFVSVSDANGLPIEGLARDAFTLTEDDLPVEPLDFGPVQNLEQPLAVALVVDTSDSMGAEPLPTALQKAVDAARSFLGQLTPQDQVALVRFSNTVSTVVELTADKDEVRSALDGLQPDGNQTLIFDAVVEGVQALQDYSGRRILVLVTDGKDTGQGVFDFDSALRAAEAASIPVYPLGFGPVINVPQLKRMAELTGGSAHILPAVSDLQDSFDTVLHDLRQQYRFSYLSSLPADDTNHELRLSVDYQGGQEFTTAHFISKSSVIPLAFPDLQEGQVVRGLVPFTPLVDWPAPLASLDITLDGTLLHQDLDEPFGYAWNATETNIQAGTHKFSFKVTDVAGNTGQQVFNLDVQPALIVKVSGLTGTPFGGQPVISAEVMDPIGITVQKVVFLVDDRVLAEVTDPPYETAWAAADAGAGTHVVRAVAYDAGGLALTAEESRVTVEVGSYGWMVPIVVLAIAGLIIPIALRSRRRAGRAVPAAVTGGQPRLVELEGLNPGHVWPLGAAEIKLGRKRNENDIPLNGLNASRRHATISFEKGGYVVHTLSPDNPVLVNNVPVPGKQTLKPGDVIRLGDTSLRFER